MKAEFVSTAHAAGWIHFEDGESFSAAAFQQAKKLGFIDIEAHIMARMSKTEKLPLFTASQAMWDMAFQPLTDKDLGLYVIVDSSSWVERVLKAGVRTVQLRIKESTPSNLPNLREEIKTSVALASRHGAQLFINDHWQMAIEEGAYGVHIGQEDMDTLGKDGLQAIADKGCRLGISTHAYWEVCKALAIRPSYIACGPIHPTAAKVMPWIPQGNDNLARATEAMQCGAASVAVISAVTAASDPESVIRELQTAIAIGKTSPKWPVPTLARPTLH